MRKINNPYTEIKGYNCFACSANNKIGLQMDFFEDNDKIISIWKPNNNYAGYGNILHGGIQSTLMDEIASWVVLIKAHTAGVTSRIDVRYKKAVYTNKGNITLKASLEKMRKNIAFIKAELFNADNELCAEANIQYFTYPEEVAKKKLSYPEYERFFSKNSG